MPFLLSTNISDRMNAKRIVIAIFLVFGIVKLSRAQDLIMMKKGPPIQAKILDVTATDVKFKRYNNLEGPTVVTPKSEINSIKYKDGRKISFADVTDSKPTTPAKNLIVSEPDIMRTTNGKELSVVVDNKTEKEYIYRLFSDQTGPVLKIDKSKVEDVAYSPLSRFYVAAAITPPAPVKTEEPVTKPTAKDDLDAKTAQVLAEKSDAKKKDLPSELELSFSYGSVFATTNQYSNLMSITPEYNYESAYRGSGAAGSTSYGILLRHRLVSFWYIHYGASYSSITTENYLKSSLSDDTTYKERTFTDKLTYVGVPVGFTFYLGNKNSAKFYIDGGMLTSFLVGAQDELYKVVYDKEASESTSHTKSVSFSPYAGAGFRFKLSNRGRLNIGANYLFDNLESISTLDGVDKTFSGLMFKAGIAIGLGSND
jgi:hypothetical protein